MRASPCIDAGGPIRKARPGRCPIRVHGEPDRSVAAITSGRLTAGWYNLPHREVTMRRNQHALLVGIVGLLAVMAGAALPLAQQNPPNPPAATSPSTASPPEQPLIIVTENQRRLRVVPLARGLSHPWGMALLPDGRTILGDRTPGPASCRA